MVHSLSTPELAKREFESPVWGSKLKWVSRNMRERPEDVQLQSWVINALLTNHALILQIARAVSSAREAKRC